MKRHYYFTISSIMLLGLLATFACCRNDAKQENGMSAFESSITNEDSVAVVNLVDQFFSYMEKGEVRAAVAMLYKTDKDELYGEPQLLDNDEMKLLATQLGAVPVYEHKIDYIKFNESYLNEVKCTVVIAPAQGNMSAATMSYYLKPVSYLGGWVLCLMNSGTGDNTFVDNADKDSLERSYQEMQRNLDTEFDN